MFKMLTKMKLRESEQSNPSSRNEVQIQHESINKTIESHMNMEDIGFEGLSKFAGKPKKNEQFPKFNSVYI